MQTPNTERNHKAEIKRNIPARDLNSVCEVSRCSSRKSRDLVRVRMRVRERERVTVRV